MTTEKRKMVTIVVPTNIDVDISRLSGDIGAEIRFEILPEVHDIDGWPEDVQEALLRGVRVFFTKRDDYLYLEPEPPSKEQK